MPATALARADSRFAVLSAPGKRIGRGASGASESAPVADGIADGGQGFEAEAGGGYASRGLGGKSAGFAD